VFINIHIGDVHISPTKRDKWEFHLFVFLIRAFGVCRHWVGMPNISSENQNTVVLYAESKATSYM
jgi:hypothetical protein